MIKDKTIYDSLLQILETDEGYRQLVSDESFQRLSELYNQENYSLKNIDQDYKVINDWTRLEVIEDRREKSGQWRKFSLVDLVWLSIVSDLRYFNFPLEKIKNLKKYLFQTDEGIKTCKYPLFEFYLFISIVKFDVNTVIPIFLSIDWEGGAEFLTIDGLNESILSFGGTSLVVNFSDITERVYTNNFYNLIDENKSNIITNTISEVLKLDSKNLDQVNFRFKEGLVKMAEVTESLNIQSKLNETLKTADFQDLEVKTQNGKVNSIKLTKKIKL